MCKLYNMGNSNGNNHHYCRYHISVRRAVKQQTFTHTSRLPYVSRLGRQCSRLCACPASLVVPATLVCVCAIKVSKSGESRQYFHFIGRRQHRSQPQEKEAGRTDAKNRRRATNTWLLLVQFNTCSPIILAQHWPPFSH